MSRGDQCKIVWDQAQLGSVVGEKGKKRNSKGKISACQAVACEGTKGGGTCWRHTFDVVVHALNCLHASRWQVRGAVDSISLFQYHAPTIREKIF